MVIRSEKGCTDALEADEFTLGLDVLATLRADVDERFWPLTTTRSAEGLGAADLDLAADLPPKNEYPWDLVLGCEDIYILFF